MTESHRGRPFDRLTRKAAVLVLLCSLPFSFLFDHLGDPARGRAVSICVAVLLTAVWVRWDLRKYVWFWITISLVLILHIPLLIYIPWTNKNYPGAVLLPEALLDFCIVYGCIKLAEKVMKRT